MRDEAHGTRNNREGHRKRWALRPYKQFTLQRTADNKVYLTRWWLFDTPLGGVALHRMTAPDARTTLHDHPMGFVSIPLRGAYIERRLVPLTGDVGTRFVGKHARGKWLPSTAVRCRYNVMRRSDAHTIIMLDRDVVWTLLLMGPNRRRWGFLEPIDDYAERVGTLSMTTGDEVVWTPATQFDSGHYVP